jgi:hypothetical protein
MKVSRDGKVTQITLDDREVLLLRRALERASYIDTPVTEQEAILSFAGKALEQLSALK